MTIEEILLGETKDIEFKEDIPPKSERYMKTVVAFTNCSGGRIVFGIENNTWRITGFNKEEVFRKMDAITNAIFDSCEPKITPNVNIQEIEGKYIIIVDLVEGMQKPYYIKKQGMVAGAYIRVSGTTRSAEKYQIQEMILDSGNRSYDQGKVDRELSDTDIELLCERFYHHALELCQTEEARRNLKRIGKNQLISYKLVIEEGDKCYATHGYQLLDGKLDEYPDAVIQCAVFKGTVRDLFITRKEFRGCIDEEIESAYAFVLEHIDLGARIDGLARQDIYELPIRSIREMISNAVCHRSYLTPGKVQVALFDDRLEVTSPGMLDSDLTLEKIRQGRSKIRNKGIAELFSYMNMIEAWGSGIPRIYEDSEKYGLPEPELLDMGNDFRVNLFRKKIEVDHYGVVDPRFLADSSVKYMTDYAVKTATKTAAKIETNATDATNATNATKHIAKENKIRNTPSSDEFKILNAVRADGYATQKQLHEMTGISLGTIKRLLPKMQEKGLLIRIGNRRSGSWKINE